jgi:hypothetical protein
MAFQVLPPAVWLEGAACVWASVRPECLVRALVLAQVRRVCACEVAEAAFVRLLAVVEGGDVGLQLGVGCGGVAAAVADVWALAGVCPLVVVFRLVCGERLGAARKTAGVRSVAAVAEEVAR